MNINKGAEEEEQENFDLEDVKVFQSDSGDNKSWYQNVEPEPEICGLDTNFYQKYDLRQTKPKPDAYIEECPKESRNRKSSNDTQDVFICDICDFTTSSEIGITSHRNSHIRITNKFKCHICQQEFSTNTLLKNHKDKHEDEIFLCKQCKLAFSNHRAYLTHMINHMTKPPYKCYECEYEFMKQKSLKNHIFTHTSDVQVQCPICKKKLGKRDLKNHMQSHHDATECVECHKQVSRRNIDYHMMLHTGLKPFQCLYCGKGFRSTSQRQQHTKIHTNYRPYKCEICNQAFHQYTDQQRHMVSKHSLDRYECDTCGKRYKQKNTLALHIRIHTNYKPYKCPKCPQAFTVLPSLKIHFYTNHVEEKRFGCEICGKVFQTVEGLRKHKMSKVHQRKEYKLKMEI